MKFVLRYFFFLVVILGSLNSYAQDSLTIPNVFTPDNDGVNDYFRLSASGFESITCTIFNRHGEPVYRFYGENGTWDGFTHAGVKVTPGTYFVLVEYQTSDGSTATRHTTLQVVY